MCLTNWLISDNIFLLMFFATLPVLFVLIILLIISIYKRMQDKIIMFKRLVGFASVFALTLIANNYWCYLALILLLAANLDLINNDVIDIIKACFDKSPSVNPFQNEEQRQERKEREKEKAEEYQREELKTKNDDLKTGGNQNDLNNQIQDVNDAEYKQYIRKGLSEYSDAENMVISWFIDTYNMNFAKDMAVTAPKLQSMYPDGIIQSENKDIVLEVKLAKNGANIPYIIKRAEKLFFNYKKLYISSKKNVEFILAIVIDELNKNGVEIPDDYTNNDFNFKIYIFARENYKLKKKMIL